MPAPELKKPADMNNFYLYLPGGSYRECTGAKGAKERTRVMDAIDQLLAGEFSHLDAAKIYQTIIDASRAVADALNSGRFKNTKGLDQLTKPHIEASDRAREELRPLFEKLIEMGFDPKLLTR